MTNKQLAKQLRDIGNSLFDRTNDPNFKLFLDEASDRLENQSKWISVEERLPEVSGDYLTFHEHGTRGVLYYNADIKLWNVYYSDDVRCAIRSITHWMPLPEAPKMKGGEADA